MTVIRQLRTLLCLMMVTAACGTSTGEPPIRIDLGSNDDGGPADAGTLADSSDPCAPGTTLVPDAGCVEGCPPWQEESGCGADEWCAPVIAEVVRGHCIRPGDGEDGDRCVEDDECVEGALCIGQGQGLGSVCRAVCEPTAADVCPAPEFCAGILLLNDDEEPLLSAVGTCADGCDYDEGVPCSDPATCVPHELLREDEDTCMELPFGPLEENEPCPDVMLGHLCAADAMCYDVSSIGGPEGLLCYEICRLDLGGHNTINHPDCSRSRATCLAIFETGTPFGLCGPDGV